MDECVDIWSTEYSYLDSIDDWLSPVRGTYSRNVESVDLNEWLNEAFHKPSSRSVTGGSNGKSSHGDTLNGIRVIDQGTRRIQPSPSRRPGIPNMGSTFETPPETLSQQGRETHLATNGNTVTITTKGVGRTKTFTRRREVAAFIKNATITKARIARRGTFSRGQMPFNMSGSNNDCDDDAFTTDHDTTDHDTTNHGTTDHGTTNHGTTNHDTTYNLNGNGDHLPTSPSDFNDTNHFVKVVSSSTPLSDCRHLESTNEPLNRQGTITKKILPSKPLIRPNGVQYPSLGINQGQPYLLNASSAPNLHAARSREQIATTTGTSYNHGTGYNHGTSYNHGRTYNHGTITKSSSRILSGIPKSNSSSR